MKKLTPLFKTLFKVFQIIIFLCIIIAVLSFEISPRYNWAYIITYFGQGIVAFYIGYKVDKELGQFYENIFN